MKFWWNSIRFDGFLWSSMEFDGFWWNSIRSDRIWWILWNSVSMMSQSNHTIRNFIRFRCISSSLINIYVVSFDGEKFHPMIQKSFFPKYRDNYICDQYVANSLSWFDRWYSAAVFCVTVYKRRWILILQTYNKFIWGTQCNDCNRT